MKKPVFSGLNPEIWHPVRIIALLFIVVNSTGVYLCNITSPALTRHCGGAKSHYPPTLAPLSPEVGGQWLQMTGALVISYKFIWI